MRQDLAAIAQRALRQQPDFGKAVEHHPARLDALDRLENLLGGLAEFEVGRIEQALLLIDVEQAFRRQQFEDFDALVQCPAVRRRAVAQFALGFGQRDVETLLAARGRLRAGIAARGWSCRCLARPRPGKHGRATARRTEYCPARKYRSWPLPGFVSSQVHACPSNSINLHGIIRFHPKWNSSPR